MEALLARRAQLKTDLALEEDKQKKFALQELLISISDEIDREREALLADKDVLLADLGEQLREAKISCTIFDVQS